MILKSLKTYFNNALLGYYPETEVNSFFFILAESILGLMRIDVSLKYEDQIKSETYNAFQLAVERLQNYEPIQYIIGKTEFYGLNFKVNRSVLIPRPETEELVNWIIKGNKSKTSVSILDIGTGSGCIAITLAKNLPNAKVYALDVSKGALAIAKGNALLNNVEINFLNEDVLNWTSNNLSFDIIASNPPYVRELEKEMMTDNVLKHEPHLALFVKDDDALLFYRKIIKLSKQILTDNGQLYFEINEYLGENTQFLMEKEGFKAVELKQDIFEKDRMIKGMKL
jgi:release factor glutamine methyltransferase